MIITITCPDCNKVFKIDVPAIEKYKLEVDRLRRELKKLKGDTDSVDYLKNIFGMD